MKDGACNKDLFWAPEGGEIMCPGVVKGTDVITGDECKITCEAAIAVPDMIICGPGGWSAEAAVCDATQGGLSPGGQIALVLLGLGLLCVGTFLWQKYGKKEKDPNAANNQPKFAGDVPQFDPALAFGMGRDGFDNLQTVQLGEMSPLPQPKSRPSGGHCAGNGIHDFMGTCTIGTVSQNPKLGEWKD